MFLIVALFLLLFSWTSVRSMGRLVVFQYSFMNPSTNF